MLKDFFFRGQKGDGGTAGRYFMYGYVPIHEVPTEQQHNYRCYVDRRLILRDIVRQWCQIPYFSLNKRLRRQLVRRRKLILFFSFLAIQFISFFVFVPAFCFSRYIIICLILLYSQYYFITSDFVITVYLDIRGPTSL